MLKNRVRIFAGAVFSISALVSSNSVLAGEKSANGAIEISDSTFDCMRDMTKVDGFYVDNLLGDPSSTVAVASSTDGGVYPPGSVVQLVPGEVMVKHGEGFSPATKDWEFFELDVSAEGTAIRKRGFVDVVNRFGGNCFGCHIKAEPKWDMICKTGHGCDPIPLGKEVIAVLQKTDPRCDNEPLSEQEVTLLKQLQQAMAPKPE
jgi:hypothetical protein